MKRFLLSSSFTLVAVVSTACGGVEGSSPTALDTPTVTVNAVTQTTVPSYLPHTQPPVTPKVETPEFWLRTDRPNRKSPGGYITAITADVPTREGIEAIVRDVRALKAHESGGWFLSIDCGHGQDDTSGNRIANAKFAFDNLGAAQTGLSKFGQTIDIIPGASCN